MVRLTGVSDGDPATLADDVRARLAGGYENMRRALTLSTLVEDLRERAEIVIPQQQE